MMPYGPPITVGENWFETREETAVAAHDFGVPPTGATVAANLALWVEEAKRGPDAETMRVPWRGGWDVLTVVSVPVNQLYLNPNTHRIRAQRSSNPARDDVLGQHPWSDEGQLYLRDLLRSKPTEPGVDDPEYIELVEELKRHGQRDPGIVTRNGVLVDANTRCVALREMGATHIRVGVLKESANWDDINGIELQIQLRKDTRRIYPYINRLISTEEQLALGMSERDVAHDWNIAEKSLKADMWAYGVIREAIDRSESDGARLSLLDFNDQQESFREFYRAYQALLATDPDGAEQMREARLASLILGLPKTSLRAVGGEFYTRYLERQLSAELKPTLSAPSAVEIPGLPGLSSVAPTSSDGARSAKALTQRLLQARAQVAAPETTPAIKAAASKVIDEANQAFRRAARHAGQDETYAKKQTAVPDRVIEASDVLNQGTSEFAKSKTERTLDDDAFDSAVLELKSSIEGLAKLAARAYENPGEGVAWLLAAARARVERDA